jgi:RNA polymerase sigma factor (sigma-70 family)
MRLEQPLRGPDATWKDDRLVGACLNGDERAWSALIQKYKNLIFSIPVKYGAGQEDAADIFQSVCMEIFTELPRLRDPGAFRSWLITVTAHQAFHWKKRTRRRGEEALSSEEETLATEPSPDLIEQVEQEQVLREAIARLSPRCQELIYTASDAVPRRRENARRGDRIDRVHPGPMPGPAAQDTRTDGVLTWRHRHHRRRPNR